jgi:hypothetical protein
LSARDTPGPTYGLRIIWNLPGHVKTREEARAHFEARRAGGGAPQKPGGYAPTQGAGDEDVPPEESEVDQELRRRVAEQNARLRQTHHATAS